VRPEHRAAVPACRCRLNWVSCHELAACVSARACARTGMAWHGMASVDASHAHACGHCALPEGIGKGERSSFTYRRRRLSTKDSGRGE
jgi:hypothetical protein